MKKTLLAVIAVISLSFMSFAANAASDAEYPEGWENWPIHHSGVIPGADEPISADLPEIVQETFKKYNWTNDGKGTKYNVRINPAQAEAHAANKGYDDTHTAVLELVDIGVIFVTDHLMDEPQYGVFTIADKKDIADASVHPSLTTDTCVNCHSGYAEICINGICSRAK